MLSGLVQAGEIVYRYQENQGCGVARNTGVHIATGDLLAFLDADDQFHPEKVAEQVRVFLERPETILCFTDAYKVDPFQAVVWEVRQTDSGRLRSGRVLPFLALRNFITLSSAMVRREAFDRVGGFEPEYGLMMMADYDLWLKLAPTGIFSAIPGPLVFYQTRLPISRREKCANHQVVMRVFRNRLAAHGTEGAAVSSVARLWYLVGLGISTSKYLAHRALLALGF